MKENKTVETKNKNNTKKTQNKKSKGNYRLIVVESPTKIKTIQKFLSSDYKVTSSKGHLIDLPKSQIGVDIENGFEPRYITIRGKGKDLQDLKDKAIKAEKILLATDPDREGEAISWLLEQSIASVLLKKNLLEKESMEERIQRIEFNEITESAVKKALENPRKIDMNRVNSQQARRILDRLVGYKISPILQDRFKSKRFSAGRVQSAALKIICDRETEIENFKPEEYWDVAGIFINTAKKKSEFKMTKINNKSFAIRNSNEMKKIEKDLLEASFSVSSLKNKERRINPKPPYITSVLQREASTRLGFRAQKTMRVAQSLYEGVTLPEGSVGLITYMRTDSVRISEEGLNMARDYIKSNFASEYLPEKPNYYAGKKGAQDAHEAIRPTGIHRSPNSIKSYLDKDQYKLYNLIYTRFLASQMSPGIDSNISIEIIGKKNDEYTFRFSSSEIKFDGFRAVFSIEQSKKEKAPSLKEGEAVNLDELIKEQKFTSPPPRYTEASLIQKMESSGIGRPATYVPTIMTLDKRNYIERKGRQLLPTKIGRVVNEQVNKFFMNIVDEKFTAGMEEKLDQIAEGDLQKVSMLSDFYGPFENDVQKASEGMDDLSHLVRIPTGKKCPECGGELYQKLGRNGFFIGCENFINGCYYSESIPVGICPKCGGKIYKKKSKKNRTFYGCENYSNEKIQCDFMMNMEPSGKTCPKCGSIMGQKVKKTEITHICQNTECGYIIEEKTVEEISE